MLYGGGFKHIHSGKIDGIATEQGYYALTAYFRMLEGKTPLYDMTDGFAVTPQQTQQTEAEKHDFLWMWIVLGIGIVLTASCLLLKEVLMRKQTPSGGHKASSCPRIIITIQKSATPPC